ncbi:MAG: N-acetyltransferase family protein [Bdellovibrionales bacterium]
MEIVEVTLDNFGLYHEHFNRLVKENGPELKNIYSPLMEDSDYESHLKKFKTFYRGKGRQGQIFAIFKSNHMYGSVSYKQKYPLEAYKHRASLAIGIERDYQSKGFGLQLTKLALEASKNFGYEYMDLEVFDSNPKAKSLYEKLGFLEYGFMSDHARIYGHSVGNYYMYLKL